MLKLIFSPESSVPALNSSANSTAQLQNSVSELAIAAKKKFLQEKSELGFAQLPYRSGTLAQDLAEIVNFSKGMKSFVIIGIGGSDLGARAIVDALLSQYQRKIYFCGDTTDPKPLIDLAVELDLETTLFVVVSKSGNTIEQASAYLYFRELLQKKLGANAATEHIVFLTDPETGALRKVAKEHGYKTVAHPSDVGGRYSVLSTVGMLPASLAGFDPVEFLAGARSIADVAAAEALEADQALQYAAWQYSQAKSGKNIVVLMPYVYGLREFARWFKQLWAESLGKKLDRDGNVVNTGTTPVQAIGPVDQHSQLQLFNEGPNDKSFTMIQASSPQQELSLPADLADLPDFSFLSGKQLHRVLNGEFETTLYALQKNGRHTCTITIPQVDPASLGALFYFFEQAVVYLGYMYNIDPFDQPGVELSKNAMFGILAKPGYESYKAEFEAHYNQDTAR